ncbi:rhamnogalacturonan acetylesterase [Paludifilum halophilum]|uniref:SGNH hydrolase-type esterase domain-containing protein n=1 Tax=Paludifilum halophilum TaxID=1642702 RepID=A0A235BDC5_9BACL|nr:rhamnogalacturonan acetylesterase [Paludifilum halophilum]OYD09595.1 hypothetical protein CHM34_00870 [Paludifilum halophilum]
MNALTITALPSEKKGNHPTIYIASDSTAQTYSGYWKPQAGWGQMLPYFFHPDVSVQNHAIGGRSTKTFYNEGRMDTILREIRPDDYLLIQFGHNDATEWIPERYTPVDEYKEYLKDFVEGVRQRDGIPVLVTPVGRRDFNKDSGEFNVSFPEYVEGMKEVAVDLDVLLVDLSTLSRHFYNEIGPGATRDIFLHVEPGIYEAFPDGAADDTHFQEYGAVRIADLLSEGIANLHTPLADYTVDPYNSLSQLSEAFVGGEGLTRSLKKKLQEAKKSDEEGNYSARDHQLDSYINQVEAHAGKFISQDHADILIKMAEKLREEK